MGNTGLLSAYYIYATPATEYLWPHISAINSQVAFAAAKLSTNILHHSSGWEEVPGDYDSIPDQG